jgi:hypothetical protein
MDTLAALQVVRRTTAPNAAVERDRATVGPSVTILPIENGGAAGPPT